MDKGSEYYRRFLEGDTEGMRELIREYSDGLLMYINTIVHNLPAAEELMMETFARLGVKRPKDNGSGSFKTWLYTMGRHLAISELRKKHLPVVSLDEAIELCDEELLEHQVIRKEQLRTVHTCMKKLSGDYAQILWLVYFEQMTTKEAARIMKRSVHAAENLVSRARKALKEELIKEGIGYEDL